jgi:hypothetical protein
MESLFSVCFFHACRFMAVNAIASAQIALREMRSMANPIGVQQTVAPEERRIKPLEKLDETRLLKIEPFLSDVEHGKHTSP